MSCLSWIQRIFLQHNIQMSLAWGQHCYTFDLNTITATFFICLLEETINLLKYTVDHFLSIQWKLIICFITYYFVSISLRFRRNFHTFTPQIFFFFFCSSVTQFLIAIFSGSLNTTLTAQRHECADDITVTATCSMWHYRCKRQRKKGFYGCGSLFGDWSWVQVSHKYVRRRRFG